MVEDKKDAKTERQNGKKWECGRDWIWPSLKRTRNVGKGGEEVERQKERAVRIGVGRRDGGMRPGYVRGELRTERGSETKGMTQGEGGR